MPSLQFKIGRGKSPLRRLLPWWWVPAIPAGLLLLFVLFLAFNRLGNEFPDPATTLEQQADEPFEETYVRDPELYFTVWQLDSQADRQVMIERWQAEIDELKVANLMGEGEEKDAELRARRIQQLAQAIDDLRARP